MKFHFELDLPDLSEANPEQKVYLEEFIRQLTKVRNSAINYYAGIRVCADTDCTYLFIHQTREELGEKEWLEAMGEIPVLLGYAIAAYTGESRTAFPNVPISPLFGNMFTDENGNKLESSSYIAEGFNYIKHESLSEDDQMMITINMIIPRRDLSNIVADTFDVCPRMIEEPDLLNIYTTEEWFSGVPTLTYQLNMMNGLTEQQEVMLKRLTISLVEDTVDSINSSDDVE